METCANCGTNIGALETPYIWQDHIVCRKCYGALQPTALNYQPPPPPVWPTTPVSEKGTSGFGIAALVLGLMAIPVAWIPFIGMVAIPIALVGLFLGATGILISAIGKRSSIGMPVAGAVVCAVAVGLVIFSTGGAAAAIQSAINTQAPSQASPPSVAPPRFQSVAANAVPTAPVPPDLSITRVDRGIAGEGITSSGWVIINEGQTPITIKAIDYNGEWTPHLGLLVWDHVVTRRKPHRSPSLSVIRSVISKE
ncbi:MAG TPA: hypothetical protein VG722_06930 [Tepidisphaeraceae bacterium]|nr:hypothetical protein [Tepidisphaeraceae bacterium]